MSNRAGLARVPSTRPRAWGVAIVAGLAVGIPTSASAQEKTFSERAKEYWEKVVSGLESGAKSAGDEYHKLKAEAATATGPAREKLAAEMEVLGKKWAAAREKLATSLEHHAHEVHDEIKALQEKAAKASGPAREKLAAEEEKLREHWHAAREKVSAALSSNMKAAGDEYAHLKGEAGKASEEAKAKLRPRMDRLKAEWSKDREKLSAYLKEDLKRTEEDLHKIGDASSEAARAAKEKLTRKLHDLRGKADSLAEDKAPDDSE
jgi:ElaB/YqjD/DUF883 family membrane-anchored ribosome-binding protein